MLNLDTHILLYALSGKVTRHEKAVLARHQWGISSIVLWEIAKLSQKGRITVGLNSPALVHRLAKIEIWPVSREVCLNLAALDFQSDPADELVAATSLAYQVPLITRDRRIRASKLLKFL